MNATPHSNGKGALHTDVINVDEAQRGLARYSEVKRRLCASDADFLAQLLKHRMLLPLAWALPSSTPLAYAINVVAKQLETDSVGSHRLKVALGLALASLEKAGCRPLLLKGHAFAQTFYPIARLRRSTDDDILVAPEERRAAHAALCAAGYAPRTFGALHRICGQATYTKRCLDSVHLIDLHWYLGNTFEYFQRFSFGDLHAQKVALRNSSGVDSDEVQGWQLAPWHSLVHASMHYFTEPLEWERSDIVLLDVALIARSLNELSWVKVIEAAQKSALSGTVLAALERAEHLFELKVADAIKAKLKRSSIDEPRASLLEKRAAQDSVFAPLRTSRSFGAKFMYAFFQLLPPPAYMRANYALDDSAASLARAYAARLLKGVRYLFSA